jgi:hypothetical protein
MTLHPLPALKKGGYKNKTRNGSWLSPFERGEIKDKNNDASSSPRFEKGGI